MYIIKTAFWLSLVILLLPIDEDNATVNEVNVDARPAITATDAVGAAISTIGDAADICDRQPHVCETGSAAWDVFQRKAIHVIDMVYRWGTGAEEAEPGMETVPYQISENATPVYTGSSTTAQPAQDSGSQNTLRLDDLIPEWTGPAKNERA